MAKRKKTSLQEDITISEPTIQVEKDPLTDQVKHFKNLGWDDNRIAARLGIHKHIVEKY